MNGQDQREPIASVLRIQQQAPRQDSLIDQLEDLYVLAARVGCYDAADWLWKQIKGIRKEIT